MYKADYHMHTSFSPDAHVPMERMVTLAIEKGLNEIAITDHMEKEPNAQGECAWSMEVAPYLAALEQMQTQYKERIIIKKGIEIGYEPRWHKEILEKVQPEDFDFIICSTHKCEKEDMGTGKFFDGKTKQQGYQRYFEEVLNTVQNFSNFDVYGHIDFVNRYGKFENKILTVSDYEEVIREILRILISKGKGLEVNTSGIRYGLGHFNPQIPILKMYLDMGGEIITIGSDAHVENHLAFLWQEAALMLKSVGFKYYTTFTAHEPIFHKL